MRCACCANPGPATRAVLWHSLLKVADKESGSLRDDLAQGSAHTIKLLVSGTIDGRQVNQPINAILAVGHDSTCATSSTPALPLIVGHILAKLNDRTRQSILRDLPEYFQQMAARCLTCPRPSPKKCAAMLVRLRAKKTVDVRGSVSAKYSLSNNASEDDSDGHGHSDQAQPTECDFAVVG